MIINETKNHQHEDKHGRVFGAVHSIMSVHTKENTIKFHNITVKQDGLDDITKCRKIGLKNVPTQ